MINKTLIAVDSILEVYFHKRFLKHVILFIRIPAQYRTLLKEYDFVQTYQERPNIFASHCRVPGSQQ